MSTTSSTSSSSSTSPSSSAALVLPQQTVSFRRMSPQEDLLATLLGIDVLVRQRQELVDRLMQRHKTEMNRRDEIGGLEVFSKDIDRIMKIRGFTVVNPDMTRKEENTDMRSYTEWREFQPRDMEPKSGIRSLQHMLNLKEEQKKLNRRRRNEAVENHF